MAIPVTSTTPSAAIPIPVGVDRSILPQAARVAAAAAIALLAAQFWASPPSRALVVLIGAVLLWTLDVLPDYVVALGVLVTWNVAGIGPSAASLSGFASPVWFLLLGVLAIGSGLTRSGALSRIALALLTMFPATFRGQVIAFLVGGLVLTPILPLTVARSALTAPLARQVAQVLGYAARSRAAVGLGLAAFAGSSLLSRVFLSGATLNLIAWSLLPPEARPGWWLWAIASAPMMLILAGGVLAAILLAFRPAHDRPVRRHVMERYRRERGAPTRRERTAGAAAAVALLGFVAGPYFEIHGAWFACLGTMALAATGVLTREHFRSAIDWPLLMFIGVILGMPAMIHHAGIDTQLAEAVPPLITWAHGSPVRTVTLLFALVTAARFVLSEWVAVPLLTAALVPIAPAIGLHPWIIAFVVLSAANVWSAPYQFASYLTFQSASEGYLFRHDQVRAFSGVYVLLSLGGLLASIPVWSLLGLL